MQISKEKHIKNKKKEGQLHASYDESRIPTIYFTHCILQNYYLRASFTSERRLHNKLDFGFILDFVI